MKPLPAKLVRTGHCVHVPALGSSNDDANLVKALLADIECLSSIIVHSDGGFLALPAVLPAAEEGR